MIKAVLKDKTVNGITTAIIVGASIFSFVSYLGVTLSRVLFEPGFNWNWDKFFTQIIILIFGLAVGAWVYHQSK